MYSLQDMSDAPILDPIDGWAIIVLVCLAVLVLVLWLKRREDQRYRLPVTYLEPYTTPAECGRHTGGVCYRCCPCGACGAERAKESANWVK